jgi:hypothetical protein
VSLQQLLLEDAKRIEAARLTIGDQEGNANGLSQVGWGDERSVLVVGQYWESSGIP